MRLLLLHTPITFYVSVERNYSLKIHVRFVVKNNPESLEFGQQQCGVDCSRFDSTDQHNLQTDRQTDRRTDRHHTEPQYLSRDMRIDALYGGNAEIAGVDVDGLAMTGGCCP